MLCERKVLPEPLLYLSAYFERNREAYYDGLLSVSRRAAWNEWIEFFARGVVEQARDAVERATRLLDLAVDIRERAARAINSAQVHVLVDELIASPFLTVNRASEVTGLAFKNAQRMVNKFEEAGLLHEITGKQRNRIYCAKEVLHLLDAPLSELPPEAAHG
jgi:Fic family protein